MSIVPPPLKEKTNTHKHKTQVTVHKQEIGNECNMFT